MKISKKQQEIKEKVEKTYSFFLEKKSINEIAKLLKISRRSVYRYLEIKRKSFGLK